MLLLVIAPLLLLPLRRCSLTGTPFVPIRDLLILNIPVCFRVEITCCFDSTFCCRCCCCESSSNRVVLDSCRRGKEKVVAVAGRGGDFDVSLGDNNGLEAEGIEDNRRGDSTCKFWF
jgi:hypothetical protein